MQNFTNFDHRQRYIVLPILVSDKGGEQRLLKALLDTGAPTTEFSDEALHYLGLLTTTKQDVQLKPGLQTQKYGKMILPQVTICSRVLNNLEVYVSHFEKSWGIKALIGLDFFRRFKVTVDYKAGHLITEAYA